ncbi:hypothetical protein AFLA_006851 [Aspergillus flavus NRRL3357]|nr:hypothetical protein AFLA_006851 [Aspergillus flavus NRRL3357]
MGHEASSYQKEKEKKIRRIEEKSHTDYGPVHDPSQELTVGRGAHISGVEATSILKYRHLPIRHSIHQTKCLNTGSSYGTAAENCCLNPKVRTIELASSVKRYKDRAVRTYEVLSPRMTSPPLSTLHSVPWRWDVTSRALMTILRCNLLLP